MPCCGKFNEGPFGGHHGRGVCPPIWQILGGVHRAKDPRRAGPDPAERGEL